MAALTSWFYVNLSQTIGLLNEKRYKTVHAVNFLEIVRSKK